MDYSKAMGPSNNITLGLSMYHPASPKGVLFYNGGGSDPNVAVAWDVALGMTNAFTGLLDYDIMFLDVRGTYSSNALNVSIESVFPLLGPYPTSQHGWEGVKKQFLQSWQDLSKPPGILGFVSTREVVEDYETIRKALGYEQIHFLGLSYGTYRAIAYAKTYPSRVGRFALDAVVPHGLTLAERVSCPC